LQNLLFYEYEKQQKSFNQCSDRRNNNSNIKKYNVFFFLPQPSFIPIQMVNQNGKTVVVKLPMEQPHIDSTETSPLNQRLRDNNSDISSSPSSAVASEQSCKKLIHNNSSNQSRKLLLNIIIDLAVLLIGEFCSVFYYEWKCSFLLQKNLLFYSLWMATKFF